MEIRENGQDRLVLENPPSALLSWISGALALFAAWLGFQGARDLADGPGWILLVGALALGALSGVMGLRSLGSSTYAFDRQRGLLVVSHRGPWRRAPREWPLAGLTRVRLSFRAGSETHFWTVAVEVGTLEPIELLTSADEAIARRLADTVGAYLNLPVDERRAG